MSVNGLIGRSRKGEIPRWRMGPLSGRIGLGSSPNPNLRRTVGISRRKSSGGPGRFLSQDLTLVGAG